jgi:hypothetical protein
MIQMSPPEYDSISVFDKCVKGIKNQNKKDKYISVRQDLAISFDDYESKAQIQELFKIKSNIENQDGYVLGSLSIKDFKILYRQYLVGSKKQARDIYDTILNSAPLGACPSCGIVDATTLDHYLCQSHFSIFSVLPLNLVPACKDCNYVKSDSIATSLSTQSLHPYFDDEKYYQEPWLKAKLSDGSKLVMNYFAVPPNSWSNQEKLKVKFHLDCFNLKERYSKAASREFPSLLQKFVNEEKEDKIRFLLEDQYRIESKLNLNSWKTAFYRALFESERSLLDVFN